MFELKSNQEIGQYIDSLIKQKGMSVRQFCRMFIAEENRPDTPENLQKMQNRMSQIKSGKKGLQLKDLPIITKLLGITCEELLSTGTSFVANAARQTNYSIAFSNDPTEWEAFVQRSDKLILNPDEYGKNAIDYAIESKNYAFLRLLMDKKYIWFDNGDSQCYFDSFGADTSIKRRPWNEHDNYLIYHQIKREELRFNVIALAIENGDKEALEAMRAREIPEMYNLSAISPKEFDITERFNKRFIPNLSDASDEIIEYFTEEFLACDQYRGNETRAGKNPYVFIFASEMIEVLVEKKHPYAEFALRNLIKHNENVYKLAKESFKLALEAWDKYMSEMDSFRKDNMPDEIKVAMAKHRKEERARYVKELLGDFKFMEETKIVSFYDFHFTYKGFVSNLVRCEAQSHDLRVQKLVDELNTLYDRTTNLINGNLAEVQI